MAFRGAWAGLVMATLAAAGCGDDAVGAGPADVVGDVPAGEVGVDAAPPPEVRETEPDGAPDGADAAAPEVDEGPCPAPTGARPPLLGEHAGAHDPARDRVVVFGGNAAVPVGCGSPAPQFEAVTWVYDVACDHWRAVDGAGPTGRARHAVALDAAGDRLILFGGRRRSGDTGPFTRPTDTWAFDLGLETWRELDTGEGPPGRSSATLVHDPEGGRVLLFGGDAADTDAAVAPLDDVWALDLASETWARIATDAGPAPRAWHAALWDPVRGRMVVHGGGDAPASDQSAKRFDDLWALAPSGAAGDQGTWIRLDAEAPTRPAGRRWAGLVYDAQGDRYVLFGGQDDGNLGNRNDLHAFDPKTGAWTTLRVADVANKPATGFCAFPADYALVDVGSPERRHAFVFTGGQAGRAFAMGGRTDCGLVDDLVALDLSAATWSTLTPATAGVSCLRRGATGCVDLCGQVTR